MNWGFAWKPAAVSSTPATLSTVSSSKARPIKCRPSGSPSAPRPAGTEIAGSPARLAGTEVGVTEPEATFSPCFGGPFLLWHPGKYAEMLAERIQKHRAQVWLVNTGWSGGAYGTGKRMKLAFTRAIIDAIHSGILADAPVEVDPVFGLRVVTKCPGVPDDTLLPAKTWSDQAAYKNTAKKLAGLFRKNFTTYESGVSDAVKAAGPKA